MVPSIYRPQALQRFSSPERIDQLLIVAGAKSWALLAGLACLFGAALVWSICGSVPINVSGSGIIQFRTGGTRATVAQASGVLSDVLVKPGDSVAQGQPIARLDMTVVAQQVRDNATTIATLAHERARLVSFYAVYLQQQKQVLNAQSDQYGTMKGHGDEEVKLLDTLSRGIADLRQRGFATVMQETAIKDKFASALQVRDTAHANQLQVSTQWQTLLNQRDQALQAVDEKLVTARNEDSRLKGLLKVGAIVRAPVSGRVVQFESQPHTVIDTGATMALIEFGRKTATAVIYVPAVDGKLITPGMTVKVSPTTVRPEQYGSIIGHVRQIGAYPATPNDMARVLNNQTLVTSFASGGAPLEVIVDLERDPNTLSGVRWTSKDGPPLSLTGGTIATARIVVERDPPITLVLPFLRHLTGV